MSRAIQATDALKAPRGGELTTHWRVLLGSFLGIASGGASLVFYSNGLLLKPVAADFSVERATASLAPMLVGLAMGVSAPFFGWCGERWGTVRVAAAAYLCMGLGLVSLSILAGSFAGFLGLACLLGLACGATTPGVLTRPIVMTFHRQRGIALGVAVTGTGIGAVMVPVLLTRVIVGHGWRGGYLVLALLMFILAPVAIWLLRGTAESKIFAAPVERGRLKERVEWMDPVLLRLALIFLLVSLAALGTVVHVVPLLTDRGFAPQVAGRYAAIMGASIIAFRLLTGWLLDRFEVRSLSMLLFMVAAAGLSMLADGRPALLLPGLVLLGLAVGCEHDLAAYLIGRYFPLRYAVVFGSIYAVTGLGAAFGPLLAAHLFGATGDYKAWLWLSVGMLVAGAALVRTLPPKLMASSATQ